MEPFQFTRTFLTSKEKDASLVRRGFTLIELMVVLAIILIVTGIALTSQNSFNRTLVLANTAYDVGLTLRSAQTYGISSRAVGSASNVGYGLDFVRGVTNSFTFFGDSSPAAGAAGACHPTQNASAPDAHPGNCVYDGQPEWVSTYTLGNGITVSDFCITRSYGSVACANTNGATLSSLDIVFARPNADAFISTNGAYDASISSACITLSASQGALRYVSISAAGEINARATSCP